MIRVALFTRPPVPGRCKTRLAAAVGEVVAASLHAAFVKDVVATVAPLPGVAAALHVTEGPDHELFESLRHAHGLGPTVAQRAGGLGDRMADALQDVSFVVGTDVPTLPVSILAEAFACSADVVLTPTADGGFALIGARSASFLRDPAIRWSSPHALADTVRAARRAGLGVGLTAPHHDVDGPDDLALVRTHLRLDRGLAPHTRAVLGIERDVFRF